MIEFSKIYAANIYKSIDTILDSLLEILNIFGTTMFTQDNSFDFKETYHHLNISKQEGVTFIKYQDNDPDFKYKVFVKLYNNFLEYQKN
ncbi:hypothetical protein [Caloramator sp. Dgby_cultured_2]|uniref:hypothetical protein n=1 Tax=Caloramator sp. Dgby_cultured_2 TaxID=3029174 RepID=UPI00237E7DB3|nr:hypothetical protein [Caloramator sp. Dgby_cultured_2]WDU82822.1 hypothetical protein PWK10_15140 [Caloramator sp. Dgby_cultured_2]